jgi:hypothetical protein
LQENIFLDVFLPYQFCGWVSHCEMHAHGRIELADSWSFHIIHFSSGDGRMKLLKIISVIAADWNNCVSNHWVMKSTVMSRHALETFHGQLRVLTFTPHHPMVCQPLLPRTTIFLLER